MKTEKKKSCRNCVFEIWAIGVGQGVFCLCQENEGKNLGYGMNKQNRPLLPASHDNFDCEHWIDEKDA
jgi:hypothetical protein